MVICCIAALTFDTTNSRNSNYVSVYNYAPSGDQIEKNEVGGPCSTYGGVEVYRGFWWGT